MERKGAKDKRKPLCDRHDRFVNEYLVDQNASRAAMAAGYSARTAYSAGSTLLRHPKVSAKLRSAMEARAARTQVTMDRVVRELARIAFSDLRTVASWGPGYIETHHSSALTDDQAAAVQEVHQTKDGIKVKLYGKNEALAKLMDHLGHSLPPIDASVMQGDTVIVDPRGGTDIAQTVAGQDSAQTGDSDAIANPRGGPEPGAAEISGEPEPVPST